eukprot:scaffold2200_cov413-Prasinococcus_capsulatus_cf.AAC.33
MALRPGNLGQPLDDGDMLVEGRLARRVLHHDRRMQARAAVAAAAAGIWLGARLREGAGGAPAQEHQHQPQAEHHLPEPHASAGHERDIAATSSTRNPALPAVGPPRPRLMALSARGARARRQAPSR